MNNKTRFITGLAFVWVLAIVSCSHYDELQKNGIESTAGKHSHNAGQDCMRCHHDGSNGYWWNAAGTVYHTGGSIASSTGTVQLWSGPRATGKMLYNLPVDRSGNFYTEKISTFRDGYYPVIISGSDTVAMLEQVSGPNVYKSCNNCHGNNGNGLNTPKITLN